MILLQEEVVKYNSQLYLHLSLFVFMEKELIMFTVKHAIYFVQSELIYFSQSYTVAPIFIFVHILEKKVFSLYLSTKPSVLDNGLYNCSCRYEIVNVYVPNNWGIFLLVKYANNKKWIGRFIADRTS